MPTPRGIEIFIKACQRPPFNRGFFRKHAISLVERFSKGPVKSQFHGVPMWFHMDNTTERKALFGHYDEAELDFLINHSSGDNKVFVDIGANSGLYSLIFAAQKGKNRACVAIEPNPKMAARIATNRALAEKADLGQACAFTIVQKAVGAADQTATLSLEQGLGGARIIESRLETNDFEQITVPQAPLQTILQELGIEAVDILKIDIEGNEDKALAPFFETAPQNLLPSAIIIEVCHSSLWQTPLDEVFAKHGYKLVKRNKANMMLSRN
jgi:FkbM family methyltransferase